jgi:hypothetical protein
MDQICRYPQKNETGPLDEPNLKNFLKKDSNLFLLKVSSLIYQELAMDDFFIHSCQYSEQKQ